jgi:hypothetical protein
MMNPRTIKRIIIIFVYIVIFSTIGILFHYFFFPSATCGDGKQNQGEAGIDCGGPCRTCATVAQTRDLVVIEKAFAFGGNDTYDVVAHVQNPNNATGATNFSYGFTLKDAQGNVIGKKDGESFILPAENKYIVSLAVPTEANKVPASVDFAITNTTWGNLSGLNKPALNIYSKRFDSLPSGPGGQVYGLLRNESVYDLNKVYIDVILRDQNGKIIGINSTEKNTVRSKEERDFLLTWPYELDGEVKNIEMEAYSNMFDSQNFIRAQ